MALESAYLSSCCSIPQADGLVSRGGGEQAAIGRPGHAQDPTGVAGEGVEVVGGLGVPEADGPVSRGGGEQAAIGRPSHAIDITGVAGEGVEGLGGLDVPEADGSVI